MNELPEKWCVKSTDESDKKLKEWRRGSYGNRPAWCCSDRYWIGELEINNYTEISFTDFRRLVLKENINEELFPIW